MATLNNLAGPVTGFFTAPVIGAVSDSLASPYGRRRPVIAMGLALTWVAGVSFALGEHVLPKHVAPFAVAPMLWLLDVTCHCERPRHTTTRADR